MTDADTTRAILDALESYRNKREGKNRYNTPWRTDADGGTLAVDEDAGYGLGLKWYDFKDDTHGNGVDLARRLGVPLPARGVVLTVKKSGPKAGYDSLADYADAHGVPIHVFEDAGWHEVTRGRGLKAFGFLTDGGMRYRYADEAKAGRKYDYDKGGVACWYGLQRAAALTRGRPLIICNGEPSTLVAQYYELPAACVTGGEKGSMSESLSDELRAAHAGPVVIAFDGDETGRKAGPALASHLRAIGFDAKAVSLGGADGYDLADFCKRHGPDSAAALASCPAIVAKAPPLEMTRDWRADGITAAQLQHTEFPPEVWAVEGVLPTGACLLAAKPKRGKSWLALQAAICIAMGRPFLARLRSIQGRVLYLDLEGTQRRIKKRMRAMIGAQREPWPDNLHIFTEWPQGPEALERLEAWLIAHPDTKLVIIDVLASFRRPMEMKESFYQYDRETVKPINDLLERYDCAGILVHHMNKARVDDIFDSISGSTGLLSVTNTQWAMGISPEDRNVVIFALQGRDIEGEYRDPLGLRWNDYSHMHEVEGSAAELQVSVERRAIIDALLADDEPRTPKEIAEELGKPVVAIKRLLGKMLDDGQVDKAGYGRWVGIRGISGNSGISGISGVSGISLETKVTQELPRDTDEGQEIPADNGGGNSLFQSIRTPQNGPVLDKSYRRYRDSNAIDDPHSDTPAAQAAALTARLAALKARQEGADHAAD